MKRLVDGAARRRRARDLTRAAGAFAAAMLASTVWMSLDHEVETAAAAALAGDARIVHASTSPSAGQDLAGGTEATAFGIALPAGAACSGDSANDSYNIQSYLVPVAVDPSTLQFAPSGDGPTPPQFGPPYETFRQPLYKTDLSPYTNAFTANASPPPGPGLIINIPDLTFGVFDGGFLPSGDYLVGIACWGPNVGTPVVDRYWDTVITVAATADAITWTVGDGAGTTTTTSPTTTTSSTTSTSTTSTTAPTVSSTTSTSTTSTTAPTTSTTSTTAPTTSTTSTTAPTTSTTSTTAPTTSTSTTVPTTTSSTTSTTSTSGPSSTSTTSTTVLLSTTTTSAVLGAGLAPSTTAPTAVLGASSSGLPRTGLEASTIVWAVLLVVFGRMTVLLGRPIPVQEEHP